MSELCSFREHKSVFQLNEMILHHIHEFLWELRSQSCVDQSLSGSLLLYLLRRNIGGGENAHVWANER